MRWGEFRAAFAVDWLQGQHVLLIGPTGAGKTTLALDILSIRRYVLVLATKPRDDVMGDVAGRGYRITRVLELASPEDEPKVCYWPPCERLHDDAQRECMEHALEYAYEAGGWCVYIDELSWMSEHLKLDKDLKTFWQQGRSLRISLVAGTQRPAWIPVAAYSMSTHLFIWGTNDEEDIARLAGMGRAHTRTVRHAVEQIEPYEALYVNTRSGVLLRTRVE